MRSFRKSGALLVLAALLASAKSDKTTISVDVKNEFDKPVDNAAIILDFLGSHSISRLGMRKPVHWEVRTNQQGRAHFPPVPQGTIQLQVITSKYQTFGKKFDVDTEERTIEVRLNAPQSQYSAHGPLKPKDPPPPK